MGRRLSHRWVLAFLFFALNLSLTAWAAEDRRQQTLRGVVLDPDGQVAADATVRISKWTEASAQMQHLRRSAVTVSTDDEGRFEATVDRTYAYVIRAESEDHPFTDLLEYNPVGRRPFIELQLSTGRSLSGQLSADGSTEWTDGVVHACDPAGLFYGPSACDEATVDADGRFKFSNLPMGPLDFYAHADGFALETLSVESTPDDEQLTLSLAPGHPLKGRVVDEDDKPIANVGMTLAQHVKKQSDTSKRLYWPVVSDEEGSFQHPGLPDASFSITAQPDGIVVGSEPVTFKVQSDVPLAPIVVAAQTRPIVVFRLVDPDGRPVTETPEILIKYSSNFSSTPQIEIRETEGAGHFEVKGIYPSRPSILIRPAQWIDLVIEDLELEAGQRLDLGERVLEPGAQLAGRVVDPDDVPVPDATVEVSFMTEYGSSSRSAQADRSGRYRVFGLPEDPAYSASATADGFRPDVQQQVAPNAEDVDFVLEPNSIVKGRVLDESGRPITMFQIGLYSEASENDSTFSAMANTNKPETIVDDEGRFVHETAPGHYTVQIDTEQTAPARRGDVELSPGETVDIGDVTLVAGLTITGRVLGPTGRGIAEAEVGTKSGDLMAQFTGATTAVADTATTDENGRFELRGFIPGSVTLSAQHAEYSAATETLELIADEEPAEVILTLEAGGDVVGVLVDDNGAPRVGAMIMLHRGLSAVMTRLSARTGAEGRYRLEQVPAGSYEAMCFLSLDNPQSRVSARISVENNQTTTFNCDPPEGGIDVSGRLLQAGSTLPNRGMILVPVDSLSGTPSMSDFTQTSSNESGHYEARVQRPGPYTVVVDGGTGSITTQIDVPAGVEKATVDVVIESGRITGTVRAADGAELERVSIQSFLLDGTGAAPGLLPGAAAQTGAGKDGRFEVAGLPMGDYRVVAIAPRYQAAELSPVSVGDGAIPDIELVLELSDVVRLRVTDPEGNPVAGAFVFITPSDLPEAAAVNAQSDINGRVRLGSPSAGLLDVVVGATGWAITTTRGVEAQTTDQDPEIVVSLRRGGRIRLSVTTATGEPASSQLVTVQPLESIVGFQMRTFMEPSPTTDASGVARIERLPAGTYRVVVGEAVTTVTVTEGGETDTALQLP